MGNAAENRPQKAEVGIRIGESDSKPYACYHEDSSNVVADSEAFVGEGPIDNGRKDSTANGEDKVVETDYHL